MGIAMGSGSSSTRAVAQLVLLDNKFATLPRVLAEGRRVINNIERVANLFITKAAYAVLITAATLGSFLVALRWLAMTVPGAVTISFLTLACAQLWHVFNMRDADSGLWRNDITANPFVWGALALCAGLILAGVYAPGLSPMLGMKPPGTAGWSLVAIASVMPLLVGQAVKSATAWRRRRTAVR